MVSFSIRVLMFPFLFLTHFNNSSCVIDGEESRISFIPSPDRRKRVMSKGRFFDTIMPVPISYGSTTTVVGDPLLRHGSPPAGDEMSVLLADSDVIPSDFDAKDGGTPVFRDVPFAILFWIHLAVMFWMGESVAPQGYQELAKVNVTEAIEEEIRKNDDDAITVQTLSDAESFVWQVEVFVRVYGVRLLLYLVLPITIFAFLSAFLLMTVIIKPYTRLFVYSTLIGSIAIASLFLISTAVASNTLPMYAIAGVSLLGVFYYVALAWRMVPFAAVNLKVALTGINKNWGLYIIALLFSVVAEVWGNYWVYVAFGVFAQSASQCPADDDDCGPSFWILVGLLFSMFWTSTVIIVSFYRPPYLKDNIFHF